MPARNATMTTLLNVLWMLSPSPLPFRQYVIICYLSCIVVYIQQDATLHSLFYLEIALHASGGGTMQPRLTFSSDTRGRPVLLSLHRQPICSNWWFQQQMLFLVAGWILKRRRNARFTAVADSVLMNSRTQKILCCIVAILLSTDAAARLCARRAL